MSGSTLALSMRGASARQQRTSDDSYNLMSVCGVHSDVASVAWQSPQYSVPSRTPTAYYVDTKAAFKLKYDKCGLWRISVRDTNASSPDYLRVLHNPNLAIKNDKLRNGIFYYIETPDSFKDRVSCNIKEMFDIIPFHGINDVNTCREMVPADWIHAVLNVNYFTPMGEISNLGSLLLNVIIRTARNNELRTFGPEITNKTEDLESLLNDEWTRWPPISIPGLLMGFIHAFCHNMQPMLTFDETGKSTAERCCAPYTYDQARVLVNQFLAVPYWDDISDASKIDVLVNHTGLLVWDPYAWRYRLSFLPYPDPDHKHIVYTSQMSRFHGQKDYVKAPIRNGIKTTGWISLHNVTSDILRECFKINDKCIRLMHLDGVESNVIHFNEYAMHVGPVKLALGTGKLWYTKITHSDHRLYRLNPSQCLMSLSVLIVDTVRSLVRPLHECDKLRRYAQRSEESAFQPSVFIDRHTGLLQAYGFQNDRMTDVRSRISHLFEPVLRAWYPLDRVFSHIERLSSMISLNEKIFWCDLITFYLGVIYHRGLPNDIWYALDDIYHLGAPGNRRLDDDVVWSVIVEWLSEMRKRDSDFFDKGVYRRVVDSIVHGCGIDQRPSKYLLSRRVYTFVPFTHVDNVGTFDESIYARITKMRPDISNYVNLD